MKIHQLSVNYSPEQDRILARINTRDGQEMRLWLTRRLLVKLWPVLNNVLDKHLLELEAAGTSLQAADAGLKKMLTDFRKEEFLREADFDTPYKDKQASLPLGMEPLLITDVDATPLASGRVRLGMNERLAGAEKPRSFQMELEPKLLQGLIHLLEKALQRSQWRGSFVAPVASEESPAADEERDSARPRYLN